MTETSNRAAVVTARVLAFARLRELLGFGERLVTVPNGTTLDGLWSQLAAGAPQEQAVRDYATKLDGWSGDIVLADRVVGHEAVE